MKNRNRWILVLIWILCIALGAGFFFKVRDDRRKNAERIAQLKKQSEASEQTDEEKLEALGHLYETLYSQVRVQNIVCWGDSAMAGRKDQSLPIALENAVRDNLFSKLTKSFGRILDGGEYRFPLVTIHNMGVTNETMRQILVRAGVNTMEVGDWIQIPADTDPVTIRLMDEEAWNSEREDEELRFARQRSVSFGKVWISDVEGSLIATDNWFDSNHPRFAFVRDEEGSARSVGAGTEVEIESASMFIGDIPIFFFENETGRSIDGFVSDVRDLVERYADTEEEDDDEISYELPYIVIFTTTEGSDMDRAMKEAFESHYIRNDDYTSDMTDRAYKKLAQQVYDNLDEQGCFNSVKEKIALAVQEAEGL